MKLQKNGNIYFITRELAEIPIVYENRCMKYVFRQLIMKYYVLILKMHTPLFYCVLVTITLLHISAEHIRQVPRDSRVFIVLTYHIIITSSSVHYLPNSIKKFFYHKSSAYPLFDNIYL